MDINFVLPSLDITGGTRVVFEYANRLSARGHDVTILHPIVPPAFDATATSLRRWAQTGYAGLRRLRTGSTASWFDLNVPVRRLLALTPALAPLTARSMPDADVTIATAWETAYYVARLPASKGTTAYLVQHYEVWPLWNETACWERAATHHEVPSLGMVDVQPRDPYRRRYKRLVDGSYDLPLALLVTSPWEQRLLERLGQSAAGRTRFGVNFEQFHYVPSADTDEPTVLGLYRNNEHKGDSELIRAFRRLSERHDDVRFVMFGVRRRPEVPEFVEFHADPSQDELRTLYSRADLLVYPSWVEGYGMPPMEAMACRTGLVSTDVGAVREYAPEEGVRFVPIRDVDAIVDAVEELLAAPDTIERMKAANHDAIQAYTWDAATTHFEELLLSLVSANVASGGHAGRSGE